MGSFQSTRETGSQFNGSCVAVSVQIIETAPPPYVLKTKILRLSQDLVSTMSSPNLPKDLELILVRRPNIFPALCTYHLVIYVLPKKDLLQRFGSQQ